MIHRVETLNGIVEVSGPDPPPEPKAESRAPSWWERWFYTEPTEREKQLERQLAETKLLLDAKTLENELLAQLLESLRRQLDANTAVAIHAAALFGATAHRNGRG